MIPERWKKVDMLLEQALQQEPDRRGKFLDDVCTGDASLREALESLLAAHDQMGSFIEAPALEAVAKEMAEQRTHSWVGGRIGSYKVLSLLGKGGMGEVYLAQDSRLGRKVAIKVLPEAFTGDPERLARFEREAKLLASLNHPNIAAIYGLEEADGKRFLVLELVEGETLAEWLSKGPLPMEMALGFCRQIAEGVETAHEKGIIHRDLKPGNVKITPEGKVKILDFGLAKALEGGTTTEDLDNSPTLTVAATESGVILGTAAYMAPEQARGKAVDRRADIWSFGVVFYEMLTGRRLFRRETVSDTLAAVLTMEPDWNALPAEVPPPIRRLLHRCLTKDRRERLQAIGDARIEINECLSAPAGGAEAEAIGMKPVATGRRREQLYGVLAIAFLFAAIISTVSYLRLARSPVSAVIAEILPPEDNRFNFTGGWYSGGPPVLSPDGRALAFSAVDASGKAMLWIRSLDSLTAQPLPGTEGAGFPFWSADSRALGFFADGKLSIIEASGGPAVVLADAPNHGGGSWSREGTLLFAPDARKGLYKVAAAGGTPVPILELDASKYSLCTCPTFLPDGKHFLYGAWASDPASTGVYFASMDGKENRLLVRGGGSSGTYASGFLFYLRDTTLVAQSFDPERGQLKGDPHPVAERVAQYYGRGFFDVSENGVLIYQAERLNRVGEKRLTWFDRAGKKLGVIGEAGAYYTPRISPDGAKLAFSAGDPNSDLWVDELARGVRVRLTNDPRTDQAIPVWSPDGSRILFGALQGKAPPGIYQKPSDGAGREELLLPAQTSDPQIWPTSWSRDGGFVLYTRGNLYDSLSHAEIWVLPLAGDREPRLFVQTPVAAYDGQFSPDNRWVAYTSKESGREEVYVVPFEATRILNTRPESVASPGGKLQISPSGGRCPRWRSDGKEIFYLAPDDQMMAAEIEARGNSFEARKAQPLFRAVAAAIPYPYDVTPDGRFVINIVNNTSAPLTLVVNWTARLDSK